MPTINEIKENMIVVQSVGDFTGALQQIATIRMMRLRDKVATSRPFVEAANELLCELVSLRNGLAVDDLLKLEKKHSKDEMAPATSKSAVIIITSNQGLIGRYNIEIYQKLDKIIDQVKDADFFVIGKKGQEYFQGTHFKVQDFPYEVPDDFGMENLTRLITLFDYYSHVTLMYSHYVNSATHEVVTVSVSNPTADPDQTAAKKGKYIFEPDIVDLINGISKQLRAALFQQQILDARLAQFSSQMIGMKTASDNANALMGDLRVEYNKQRRKLIDKKISEVFAGSALW